jgi:hypothetical protein
VWELSRTFVISSTLRYLLWRGERYAHRIRDLSLYPSIHGTHGDVFNWDASKFGRSVSQAVGLSGGAILSSMLVSSISLSLLLRLNTGAPQFFLISLNSIRNRHSVPSLDKLPLSLTC